MDDQPKDTAPQPLLSLLKAARADLLHARMLIGDAIDALDTTGLAWTSIQARRYVNDALNDVIFAIREQQIDTDQLTTLDFRSHP